MGTFKSRQAAKAERRKDRIRRSAWRETNSAWMAYSSATAWSRPGDPFYEDYLQAERDHELALNIYQSLFPSLEEAILDDKRRRNNVDCHELNGGPTEMDALRRIVREQGRFAVNHPDVKSYIERHERIDNILGLHLKSWEKTA